MDVAYDRPEFSREPTLKDLIELCRHLNAAQASYVVIGGFAIILNGYIRTTGDIDLLVDGSPENINRIKQALLYLPDQAINEVSANEVAQYVVVRVADEIVVDLMQSACAVTYAQAKDHVQFQIAEGVRIPFLRPELLLQTKQTLRPKDVQDRLFLEQLLLDASQTTTIQYIPASSPARFFFPRIIAKLRRFLGGLRRP